MKNAQKLFALLFLSTLIFSCTPDDITEDGSINPQEILGTGNENSDVPDDDKDGD